MPEPMPTLRRERTERSPLLELDFAKRRLLIAGESYPEDAAAFFSPVLQALGSYLPELGEADPLLLEVRLAYFNSSSAKALMNIFQMLEKTAARGVPVTIDWFYHPDDETMLEMGEDFAEDFEHARFRLCAEASLTS